MKPPLPEGRFSSGKLARASGYKKVVSTELNQAVCLTFIVILRVWPDDLIKMCPNIWKKVAQTATEPNSAKIYSPLENLKTSTYTFDT